MLKWNILNYVNALNKFLNYKISVSLKLNKNSHSMKIIRKC